MQCIPITRPRDVSRASDNRFHSFHCNLSFGVVNVVDFTSIVFPLTASQTWMPIYDTLAPPSQDSSKYLQNPLFQNSSSTVNIHHSCHKRKPGLFTQCASVLTGQKRTRQYHAIPYNPGQLFKSYRGFVRVYYDILYINPPMF